MRIRMTLVVIAVGLLLVPGYVAAENLSGTIHYSGSKGPVSASHPIRLFLFQNDPLQAGGGDVIDVDLAVVNANGGSFTLRAPSAGNYYLAYELDTLPNGEDNDVNVGEPYQFYNHRFVASADAVAVPQAGLPLDFDDTAGLPGIAGTITYTGSRGSVSVVRKLKVATFADPSLTEEMDTAKVVSNGGRYDSIAFETMPLYLRAWFDVDGNGRFDSDEPFQVYNGRSAAPGDAVVPGSDQDAVNFEFGDSPPPTTTCAGDCDGGGDVTVNEIITLVNITLGVAQPSVCADGIPSGRDVDITLIIQAVGIALTNCPAV